MPQDSSSLLYNLLDEPLLGVEDLEGHRTKVTLPGLLARLSRGVPTALTATQAHQQHPVHAFLVQLAALALARAGKSEIAHDEPSWRALLLDAAQKDGAGIEAFTLIVRDLTKPAFLQPPVPEGALDGLKNEHARPSAELDVLITSKNHDVKVDRLGKPGVEHWVFALLTLQTMQGFLGAGNYGIARMNGGFASRPCVAFASREESSARFVRDVQALLGARSDLLRTFGSKRQLGLVWCAPWDGTTSLGFSDLDPFFIEICRRVRLTIATDGTILAHRGPSKAARIDAKESAGNTGDAWTPVARKDGKALTMPEAGFHYTRVQDLLFGEWEHGAAGKPDRKGGDRLWVGQVLVRGQGKTGGYHERWLPVPSGVRRIFAQPDARERLGKQSQEWVRFAADTRLKILKPALLTLLQGAPEKLKFEDDRADPFLAHFDAAVDDVFFQLLFSQAEAPPQEGDAAFQKELFRLAKAELESALGSLPVPSARRWRAEAKANDVLRGAAHNHLKLAFAPAEGTP